MAWVRPKRRPKKAPADPDAYLRGVLGYICGQPAIPKIKPIDRSKGMLRQLQMPDIQEVQPVKPKKQRQIQSDHHHPHHKVEAIPSDHEDYHPRESYNGYRDHEDVDHDQEDRFERIAQRVVSQHARKFSQPSPPPPPLLPLVREKPRPVPKPRMIPSRHNFADDTLRRPSSRWENATTPLQM